MTRPTFHLVRTAERADEADALADRLGGRVGLAGVLDDLNRAARPTRVPGRAASWGFRWDVADEHSRRWWPQGITTSADAADASGAGAEPALDRAIILTSAYAKKIDGVAKGSRLTFVDLTDRERPRYRHVLLVEPRHDPDGRIDLRPMPLHAGGIVWHRGHVHVAGTRRGLVSFRLDDILRVPPGGDRDRLAVTADRVHGFGYGYLLPMRFGYDAVTADGAEPMRYSFVSLGRGSDGSSLVVGEYGHDGMPTRLATYAIDPTTGLLRAEGDGASWPTSVAATGVERMQGATVVDGRWYLTTSAGRFVRGHVWSGAPGRWRRHRFALPVGPEDLCYWPSYDELWSLSEHPGRRYVFSMPRSWSD